MIPTFVISIPDCQDRRNTIADRLNTLGIAFEFVDAVDGRDGLDPTYENQIDRIKAHRADRRMTDVEFACALSHVKCYRRIIADNVRHALILEDDAVPSPDLRQFLAGKYYEDVAVTQLYIRGRPYVQRGAKPLFGNYVSYLCAPGIKKRAGAVGYVMSLSGAKHFIEHIIPIRREADRPDCADDLIARCNWRVVHPLLVRHPSQEGQSLLDAHGRRESILESLKYRKFLDSYHRHKLREKCRMLPRKIFYKRLPGPTE